MSMEETRQLWRALKVMFLGSSAKMTFYQSRAKSNIFKRRYKTITQLFMTPHQQKTIFNKMKGLVYTNLRASMKALLRKIITQEDWSQY